MSPQIQSDKKSPIDHQCPRTLVLACGNTLRGDDGVGCRIGSLLIEDPPCDDVQVILTQQLLPEHAETLSNADIAIFLDCSALIPAGTVTAFPVEPAASLSSIFTHHLDPAALLRLARHLYGRSPSRAMAIMIGGECFDLNEELSAPIGTAIPVAVAAMGSFLTKKHSGVKGGVKGDHWGGVKRNK